MFEPQLLDKSVIEFCKQNKYDVRLNRISANSCLTVFPDNILSKKPFRGEYISYTINGESVTKTDGRTTTKYSLPKYLGRTFILEDIFLKCKELNIPIELCSGYNEKDELLPLLIDVFDRPNSKDFDKEQIVIRLASEFFKGRDVRSEAEKLDVLEGYNVLVAKMIKHYSE